MLCENALALGCEQSNIFCLNISVYHNNRSNQHANKDRYYCTTKRTLLLWFWVPLELNGNSYVNRKPTFWYSANCDFQTFVTFWRQTDRQSRRQCRRKWRHLRRWRPSTPSTPSTRQQSFYAVVIRDVIKGSTRSSTVTSSTVLRGVELVSKVSFGLPVKPLAAIHANFV